MALEAPVLDTNGQSSDALTLDDNVFGAELSEHLIHETVRAEFADARAGTRGAKSRGQVAGGGAKPWRQKGTGRARQGTIRAVQFEGGGVAFPPVMRTFAVKVNRKVRAKALRSALSAHVSRSSIGVVDAAAFDTPSTKVAAGLLSGLGVSRSILVVCQEDEVAIAKSFRNIAGVQVRPAGDLEVRDLVWARSLLMTKDAIEAVTGRAG
jgi:large subunit ribosomal protein L4